VAFLKVLNAKVYTLLGATHPKIGCDTMKHLSQTTLLSCKAYVYCKSSSATHDNEFLAPILVPHERKIDYPHLAVTIDLGPILPKRWQVGRKQNSK
jgi:hypothetical protein